jgi:hypothetical protein
VAYLLKAKNVEPEKQPFLANGYETTLVLGNGSVYTFPLQTNKLATTEVK